MSTTSSTPSSAASSTPNDELLSLSSLHRSKRDSYFVNTTAVLNIQLPASSTDTSSDDNATSVLSFIPLCDPLQFCRLCLHAYQNNSSQSSATGDGKLHRLSLVQAHPPPLHHLDLYSHHYCNPLLQAVVVNIVIVVFVHNAFGVDYWFVHNVALRISIEFDRIIVPQEKQIAAIKAQQVSATLVPVVATTNKKQSKKFEREDRR